MVVVNAIELEQSGALLRESHSSRGDMELTTVEPFSEITFPDEGIKPLQTRFLDYAPLQVPDFFLLKNMNAWRAAKMHGTLALIPKWGDTDTTIFQEAVEICRGFAALEVQSDCINWEDAIGLYLAGVIFGGPERYPV